MRQLRHTQPVVPRRSYRQPDRVSPSSDPFSGSARRSVLPFRSAFLWKLRQHTTDQSHGSRSDRAVSQIADVRVMTAPINTTGTPGAVAQPAYMHRVSRVYAIYESEMQSISTLNVVATSAFALFGSFLSFAVGLSVADAMEPSATAQGRAIVALGVPVGLGLAAICLVVGVIAWRRKGGTLDAIRSESRELGNEPSPEL